jgi:uncharacterized protein
LTETIQRILVEFRQGLEQIYGPRLAGLVLFGSQARGDARPDSDIDVMLVLDGPVNRSEEVRRISRFRADLCLRHNVVISCVYVSAAEAESSGEPLLQNIRTEGVTV